MTDTTYEKHLRIVFSKKELQAWVDKMPERLAWFFENLPEEVSQKLDFSVESVMVLEAWWLDKYKHYEDILSDTDGLWLDGAARYWGEIFRKLSDGEWTVELRPKYMYYAIPVINFLKWPKGVPRFAQTPFTLMIAALDRRTGVFLTSVLEAYIERLSEM